MALETLKLRSKRSRNGFQSFTEKYKLLEDLSSTTLLKVKNGGYRSWLTAETRTSMT